MSILVENECGWVICHEKSVEDIYTSVNIGSQGLKENLKYKADLFNIRVPYYYMMEDSHVTSNCVVSADVKPNRVSAGVKLNCVLDAEENTNCELEAEVKPNCVLAAEVKPNCESAEVKPNCVLATEGNTNCVPAAEGKPNCVLSAESNLNRVLAAEVKPDCVLAAEMKPNCVSAAGTQNVGNADATHRKRKVSYSFHIRRKMCLLGF